MSTKTTPTTEAFEATLRAEFEAWAKERGHPLCDVIPKYGTASSMSETTLRFSDIAWEAYQAADKAARATIKQSLTVPEALMPEPYAWHYWNSGGTTLYHRGPSMRLDADLEAAATFPRVHHIERLYTADQLHEATRAATERAAKQVREAMLSADDMADLERLREVFDDGEGWDLPKERMKRLAELGVVRWHGVTRYSITSFGLYCLGDFELPLTTVEDYNAKAYAEMLERNGIDAAAIRGGAGKGNADV